jgi:hypothetical protein
MDWSGVERDDFIRISYDRIERLVKHGGWDLHLPDNLLRRIDREHALSFLA